MHALISLSGEEICAYKRVIYSLAVSTFRGLSASKIYMYLIEAAPRLLAALE